MAQNQDVYTISEEDVLSSIGGDVRFGRGGSAAVRPDRRPSPSMRGAGGDEARALAASTLSLFFCGAGQMYNGQAKLGLLMLLTQILAGAVNWAVIQLWPTLVELGDLFSVSEWKLMLTVAAADFCVLLLMLTSVYQAYRHADEESGGFDGAGNPIFSGLASLIVPGWGQLVNAQAGKAIVFLFSLLCGAYVVVLARLTPFLRLLETVDPGQVQLQRLTIAAAAIVGFAAVMWVLSVYDAILVAGFRRRMR